MISFRLKSQEGLHKEDFLAVTMTKFHSSIQDNFVYYLRVCKYSQSKERFVTRSTFACTKAIFSPPTGKLQTKETLH